MPKNTTLWPWQMLRLTLLKFERPPNKQIALLTLGLFVISFLWTLQNLPQGKTWLDTLQVFSQIVIATAAMIFAGIQTNINYRKHSLEHKKTMMEFQNEGYELVRLTMRWFVNEDKKNGKNKELEEKVNKFTDDLSIYKPDIAHEFHHEFYEYIRKARTALENVHSKKKDELFPQLSKLADVVMRIY